MVHIIHQPLILTLIHDRNDLMVLFHVIGSDGFINRCSAVQIVDNEFPKLLFLLRDDADPAFDVVIENKMIQNDSIKIGSQNTQDQRFLVIDKSRRWWRNRWKYQLVYNENLVESFWWLARNRINY